MSSSNVDTSSAVVDGGQTTELQTPEVAAVVEPVVVVETPAPTP